MMCVGVHECSRKRDKRIGSLISNDQSGKERYK